MARAIKMSATRPFSPAVYLRGGELTLGNAEVARIDVSEIIDLDGIDPVGLIVAGHVYVDAVRAVEVVETAKAKAKVHSDLASIQ